MMDIPSNLQLEILCRDSCTTTITDSDSNHNRIQAFFDKIRELIRPDKYNVDSWEIPVDKINILQELQGSGSQGDVYYGKMNQKAVAIKKVKDKSLMITRSYLRNLDHKNVIKFKGVNSNENYIIMEWCHYGNLQNLIHNGRQIPAEILGDFGHQIASGMSYLHSKNIIHCDLKPSNILITHNNVLKISDFESHQLPRESRPNWGGTHAYMAPEMIRQETFSFPVDVWSYGVVLWEILTGHEPKEYHPSLSALSYALSKESDEAKLHIPSSFPAGYTMILEGCWQWKPKDRLTFPQICLKSLAAMQEIHKISIHRWIPLQSQWNNSIRKMKTKINPDEVDLIAEKKRCARDREQINRDARRNQDLYLQLQETSMLLAQFRKELEKQKQDLDKRQHDLEKREEEFKNRERLTASNKF